MKPEVILDSGAYTAHRKGKDINIQDYIRFLQAYGKEFTASFNLDSISTGRGEGKAKREGAITPAEKSYNNWKLLKEIGIETIPIYHLGTDEKWLKAYLEETDYIGIGAIANLDTTQRLMGLSRIWKQYLTTKDGLPKVRVHGLGLTAIDIMVRYPWYSVDSFTPVISAVWGNILLPRIDHKKEPHYFDMRIIKASDQGMHMINIENSYLAVPKINRDIYSEMIKELDFELGDIAWQEKKDRRGKKGEQARKPEPIWDLIKPSDPNIKTIANSWEVRMKWNLIMWNRLKKRLPAYPRPFVDEEDYWPEKRNRDSKTKNNMGVSTLTHLSLFSEVKPKHDILISYAYMTDAIHEAVKTYVG